MFMSKASSHSDDCDVIHKQFFHKIFSGSVNWNIF